MIIYQLEIVPDAQDDEPRITMGLFSSEKLALRHAGELWRAGRIADRVEAEVVGHPGGDYRRADLQISWYTVDVPAIDVEGYGWLGLRQDAFFVIEGGHR